MSKLLIIGFDGMTWDVADQLELPNLEALVEEGGRSELQSTYPPVTCPAWPSYLTGKKSNKHGLYDFASLSEEGTVSLSSYEDFQTPTLIDVLNQEERPSVFFEIPLTHPAPNGLAQIISGYPSTSGDEKFSSPSLREDIEETFGSFPPMAPTKFTGSNQRDVEDQFFEATRYRARAFKKIVQERDWQFATINFHVSDQFGHYFFDRFEKNPDNNPLTRAYRLLDKILGETVKELPDQTNVLVISDHGHGQQNCTVNLNYALIQGGFLKLNSSLTTKIKTSLMKAGITPESIKKLLDQLNLTWLTGVVSREKRDQLLNKFLSYDAIDWDNTEAFAFGHMGQLYWTGSSRKKLRELKNFLLDGPFADKLQVNELIDIREGTDPSRTVPKWAVRMNDWANVAYPLLLGKWAPTQEAIYSGSHRSNGLLAFNGPDLTQTSPETARLIDIAPTVHRLLELAPQSDFDGRALESILGESAPDALEPKNYQQTNEEDSFSGEDQEERVEQLKNLGYL